MTVLIKVSLRWSDCV